MPNPENIVRGGSRSPVLPVITALAALAIGAFAGYSYGLNLGKKQHDVGYQAGFDAAKQKVAASNVFPAAKAIKSIAGTVKTVGDGMITIQVPQTVRNPLEQPAPTERTVRVTASTTIVEQVQATQEERQKMMADYAAKSAAYKAATSGGKTTDLKPPTAPQPFTEKTLTLKELKPGASVIVMSAADLTLAASFEATEIRMRAAAVTAPGVLNPKTP